jgi:hypothetical protein
MIVKLNTVDIAEIIKQYTLLEQNIVWSVYNKGKQTSLQYKEGDDVWASSTGISKGKERTYNLLNPYFKNSIFEEVIQQYNLTRSRLMWINPGSCYTIHTDETQRIHIPIFTNEQAFIVFKEESIVNLPVGHIYLVDTRKEHTAMNCSMKEPRLHFVGATEI